MMAKQKKHGKYIVREYTVIEIMDDDDSEGRCFECIPNSWFTDETKMFCHWPPKCGTKTLIQKAINCDRPDDTWGLCECKVVSGGYSTYSSGFKIVREKCSQKYNTSSADDHIAALKYRRQHPVLALQNERNFEKIFSKQKDSTSHQNTLQESEVQLNEKSPNLAIQNVDVSVDVIQNMQSVGNKNLPGVNVGTVSSEKRVNANEPNVRTTQATSSQSAKDKTHQQKQSIPDSNINDLTVSKRRLVESNSESQRTQSERPGSLSGSLRSSSRSSRSSSRISRSSSRSSRSSSRSSRSSSRSARSSSRSACSSSSRTAKDKKHQQKQSIPESKISDLTVTKRRLVGSGSERQRTRSERPGSLSGSLRSRSKSSRSSSRSARSSSGSSQSRAKSIRPRGSRSRYRRSRSRAQSSRSRAGSSHPQGRTSRSRAGKSDSRAGNSHFKSSAKTRLPTNHSNFKHGRQSTYDQMAVNESRQEKSQKKSIGGSEPNSSNKKKQQQVQTKPLESTQVRARKLNSEINRPTNHCGAANRSRSNSPRQSIYSNTRSCPSRSRSHNSQQRSRSYRESEAKSFKSKVDRMLKLMVTCDERQMEQDRRLNRLEVTMNKMFIMMGDLSNARNSQIQPDFQAVNTREINMESEEDDEEFDAPKLPIKHLHELDNLQKDLKDSRYRRFLLMRERDFCTPSRRGTHSVTVIKYLTRFISLDVRCGLTLKEKTQSGYTLMGNYHRVYLFLIDVLRAGYRMVTKYITTDEALRTVWGRSKQMKNVDTAKKTKLKRLGDNKHTSKRRRRH